MIEKVSILSKSGEQHWRWGPGLRWSPIPTQTWETPPRRNTALNVKWSGLYLPRQNRIMDTTEQSRAG